MLIYHHNKEVKEVASELFEKYIETLADSLDKAENKHKVDDFIIE